MIVLSCSGISFSFGTDRILDNISFNLQLGERTGLVGVNGAGKTTLFKIICGVLRPDSGDVFISKGQKLGYLDQNSGLEPGNTIWDELLKTYSHLVNMEERLKLLEKKISAETGDELDKLMKDYDNLMERFSREGGYEYNSRVRGVLRGLGFQDSQFSLRIKALSGGQKTRLALAKLLLEEPDILMLDEPTNHLDVNALEWLEDYLKNYKKCLFVISHDRYFLDAVTAKTIELENCECKAYNGGYSAYARQKTADRLVQQKHYETQQREISRMEAFIEQQRRWNREKNIVAAESRQKAIDRLEKLDAPKKLPDKIRIKFNSSVVSGNDVLFVEDLTKEFPGKPLFSDISFEVKRNERVFLLGPNGCGKTTLLKILSGKLEQTSGDFEYGHKLVLGYYDQELEGLDVSKTVLEEVWDENERLTHTAIRNVLAQFLFIGEDVYKPVHTLSGGEKSRVALAKLMLSGSNLLILDEPTNHLDIESREALEEALLNFDGTILAVSHDRYFINKLATRVLEMFRNSVADYKGDYAYYLEKRRLFAAGGGSGSLAAGGGSGSFSSKAGNGSFSAMTGSGSPGQAEAQPGISQAKLERLESKEEKSRQRRLEKQLAETESEMGKIEGRLGEIERDMSAESAQSDHVLLTALLNEQASLKARLDELYETWASLMEGQP